MALTRKHFNAMADIFSKRMKFYETVRRKGSARDPNFDTKRWVNAMDCRGWLTGFHD
tara:strand:+ start:174 stop:344 length:171 start_codon:yes stop_codon:yes gene_type:complete